MHLHMFVVFGSHFQQTRVRQLHRISRDEYFHIGMHLQLLAVIQARSRMRQRCASCTAAISHVYPFGPFGWDSGGARGCARCSVSRVWHMSPVTSRWASPGWATHRFATTDRCHFPIRLLGFLACRAPRNSVTNSCM